MAAPASTLLPSDRVAAKLPGAPVNVFTVTPFLISMLLLVSTRLTMPPMASFAHSPDGTSLA
jgi:hypothetical protein